MAKKLRISSDVTRKIQNSQGNELELLIKRDGEYKNIVLRPTLLESEGISAYFLGIIFKPESGNFSNRMYYAFWNTTDFIFSIADNVKQLFTGKVTADQMMGPVGISEVVVKTNGIREFVYMLALVSMSLGVTNLLPFPPLDGGKIVFLLIEAIRKKPIKQETEAKIQLLGFAILITISFYITYNDILRIF